jgi:hypothetical protein
MIVALGDVYAQGVQPDKVRELLGAAQVRVREQPGCVSYGFAEGPDDPGHPRPAD